MTDFQNWWDGYFHEINGQKETAQAAWQARGELDKALAETQEPMIIKQENGMVLKLGYDELPNGTAFYTTPPSREWVGLSDEEIWDWDIANFLGKNKEWDYPGLFAKTIERALREKNNG